MQIIFSDGLGNQMFQYALFLALRHKGRKAKINTGIMARNVVHNGFELCDAFMIDKDKLPISMSGRFAGGITIFVARHLGMLCYKQNIDIFSNEVFQTKRWFVSGYWQDERYFKEIEYEVRNTFVFRNIDSQNKLIGNEMKCCNSVSLHIRRGDYLKYANYQVCTPEYYEKAIEIVRERITDPVFYIFSDDLAWSEEFVRNKGVNYKLVDGNRGRDSYKDMYLMTCCRHHIIANSSFSWWGAWLGENKNRFVICPSIWLKNHSHNPSLDKWTKVTI